VQFPACENYYLFFLNYDVVMILFKNRFVPYISNFQVASLLKLSV